jgi:uncharacterized protein YndB with AHSA1/START domain
MNISDQKIEKQRIINQPLDILWWKWSTHEGLLTFFGYNNKIELTPGGAFEIYFHEDNPVGLKGSEDCKIVSFIPNQNITFTWNSPPQFEKTRKSSHKTIVEITLTAVSEKQTEVKINHSNWPQNIDWEDVFDYFDIAWDVVLNNLDKSK